ncbi:hypothetical protein H6G17_08305 [Chroococcidiopsis sp. FACHB-1243]|uniref:hypothetical protein n=1 Tax=Chroococcidiopsis sp. [FACHB-1243] TaxID=2692781 RepID=UPI001783003C|nr:hypothetical protein [Chroococcidiopsis sp. [FACHB-1243]]MBD2305515.1 hypothetical protein [Chroococcidiopsis sp. [FACHB-1243]]
MVVAGDRSCFNSLDLVFWAGDLDRDGKLDLLIELASHANISSLILFLSSPAKEHKLLEPVAQFVTQGC